VLEVFKLYAFVFLFRNTVQNQNWDLLVLNMLLNLASEVSRHGGLLEVMRRKMHKYLPLKVFEIDEFEMYTRRIVYGALFVMEYAAVIAFAMSGVTYLWFLRPVYATWLDYNFEDLVDNRPFLDVIYAELEYTVLAAVGWEIICDLLSTLSAKQLGFVRLNVLKSKEAYLFALTMAMMMTSFFNPLFTLQEI